MGEVMVFVVIYRDGWGNGVCGYLQRWVEPRCLRLPAEIGKTAVCEAMVFVVRPFLICYTGTETFQKDGETNPTKNGGRCFSSECKGHEPTL